ncbi:PREDICTED: cytoplasmic dynein 2 light intermediate chain 1 [Ceratosolen solmsi marchali]|uniref:Cytoplasmic dynein 2 light intermediate chain 1 n=1 Tax=Ceratosolen solmsi marchali TaxID=326594 RepID=A0AAJ6YL70_9HYME|nr:PREDICTED: cytoplasmic dynein 2 light intermediate chain 1 [Ceratosolen solmsi marchali]
MVHRFLEREDSPKPTIVMDYYYGRKAGKSLVKDIVHIWEVASLNSHIIRSALSGCSLSHLPHHTTIMIMLDLRKPAILWNYLEECLTILSNVLKESYPPDVMEKLKERKLNSLREQMKGKGSEMESVADLFPLRLCLIGGRYDNFRDFEGVDREFIGQILRAVAHVLGATLHYHSAKDSQLLRKTKELLGLYGFKGEFTKTSMTDYNKPLYVAAGSDSLAAIDLEYRGAGSRLALSVIKEIYVARFPQSPKRQASFEDSSDDPNFDEPIIDRLRLQREQEISVSLRDMMEGPATNIPIPEPF